MKKINSIGYGSKVIDIGIVLLAVIPLMLKAASYITGRLVFPLLGKISFCCGAVIFEGLKSEEVIELLQKNWVFLKRTLTSSI